MTSSDKPLAILSAVGSRGDVNPMVAIGRQLRQTGFDATIALAAPYVSVAADAGLDAIGIVDDDEFQRLLGNASMWRPIRGVRRLLKDVACPMIDRHLRVIESHLRPGRTVLVSHPLDLASRIYRHQHPAVRLVDVHLAPAMLRSNTAPPRLTPWPIQPRRPSWLVRSTYALADHLILDPIVRRAIRQTGVFRGEPVPRRIFDRWWLSPDKIIAMYPRWYAPELIGDDPRLDPVGFPGQDFAAADEQLGADQLRSIAADRPIVFTAGTANHHAKAFFQTAAIVCGKLGKPALLLSKHAGSIPANLPDLIQFHHYLPLKQLLPHCCCIVHHGGVGTTSAAFAAGIPQIIRPLAYDQFDNADRVQTLGCGVWCRRKRDLAWCIEQVLGDETQATARDIATRFVESEPAAVRAADIIRGQLDLNSGEQS